MRYHTAMETYLYEDLYVLEDKHWWHQAKRQLVSDAITKFTQPATTRRLKILDLGCGTGKNLEHFQQFGAVFGVDGAKEALQFCRQRGLTQVKLADLEKKLPFADNSFDVITLLDVLEHIKEPMVLQEVQRILKPNGLFIVTVPAFPWLWSAWDEVLHHKRRYTRSRLVDVISGAGFKPEYSSYVYGFLVPVALIVRWVKSRLPTTNASHYSSDFKLNHPWLNAVMMFLASVDRWLLWQVPLPVGTSVFMAARKGHDG